MKLLYNPTLIAIEGTFGDYPIDVFKISTLADGSPSILYVNSYATLEDAVYDYPIVLDGTKAVYA